MTATATRSGRARRRLGWAGLWMLATTASVAGGCTCSEPGPSPAAPSASAAASEAPTTQAVPTRPDTDVKPVYPIDAGPPDPLAIRFCDAVQTLPDKRKGECCPSSSTGFAPADQCVRTLSYALSQHAIKLDPAAVDRCAEAMKKATTGCDWVTPYSIKIPPECSGIFEGTLKDGDTCRSSLECVAGLRCKSLSATDLGRCGPPRATKLQCGVGIDTLATYTRQDTLDRDRPECAGYCLRGRCEDAVAIGGACTSEPQCGKNHCVEGKCSAAPAPAKAAPKAEGESCEAHAECRGECVPSGDSGPAGTCAKHCPVFLIPGASTGAAPRPTVPDGTRIRLR